MDRALVRTRDGQLHGTFCLCHVMYVVSVNSETETQIAGGEAGTPGAAQGDLQSASV